jgi:hypothetical protein
VAGIYPNPCQDICLVKLAGENTSVTVYDLNGKLLLTSNKAISAGEQFVISTENFVNGVYFVKVQSENNSQIIKLVVAH